jgi:MFS family permease
VAGQQLERGVWSPAQRRLTTGLVLTVTMVAFENLSVATILPVITRHLGDLRLYGWVFSAFLLASLVGIVTGGALCDRSGLALPLIGGLALFCVGLVIAGTAVDMPVLVGGRVVQGLGAGTIPAAAYVAIGRSYDKEAQPRMFAVLSTAWVVPGLVGPVLAAQIALHAGWRWVFLGLVPLTAVAAVVTVPALSGVPPSVITDPAPIPLLDALAVAGGAVLVLGGLTIGNPLPTVLCVLAGGAVLTAGVRRLTPPGTLRARSGVGAAVLGRGLLTFSFFAGDAFVPLTLTAVRHTSTTYAGLTLTAATIAWTAGSWVQARLVGQVGPRALIRTGQAVVLAGVVGFATILVPAVPVGLAPVFWAIAGLGIGVAYAPTTLTALGWSNPGQEGRASAAVQLTDVLGTALGTGTAGAAVAIATQHGHGPERGLAFGFGSAALVAVVGLLLSPRLPTRTTRPTESIGPTGAAEAGGRPT